MVDSYMSRLFCTGLKECDYNSVWVHLLRPRLRLVSRLPWFTGGEIQGLFHNFPGPLQANPEPSLISFRKFECFTQFFQISVWPQHNAQHFINKLYDIWLLTEMKNNHAMTDHFRTNIRPRRFVSFCFTALLNSLFLEIMPIPGFSKTMAQI